MTQLSNGYFGTKVLTDEPLPLMHHRATQATAIALPTQIEARVSEEITSHRDS